MEAFTLLTVLAKAGKSHVCTVIFFPFSLQANELETCTSVSRLSVKRKRMTENGIPAEDVKFQKLEY